MERPTYPVPATAIFIIVCIYYLLIEVNSSSDIDIDFLISFLKYIPGFIFLVTRRRWTSAPSMSLRVSPVPTLDRMRFSILFQVSSYRGILMVSVGLATLRMS